MKNRWLIIFGILLVAIGGILYWNWTLLQPSVLAQPSNPVDTSAVPNSKTDRINVLLLGTDSRGNEPGRTDSIILISADYETHKVDVVSIPRDTRVAIPGVGLTKITHANVVGEANGGVREGTLTSVQAASDLLGVTINDYAKVNFGGFEKIVDALGGIDVTLPVAVNDDLRKIHLSAGTHHLNGDEALRLSRARYGLPGGDFDRQRDQYYLLAAAAEQALSLENIKRAPEMLDIVREDLLDTSFSEAEMLALGLEFKGLTGKDIKYYQIPGKGTTAQDPLVGANVYYYEPDRQGIQKIMAEILQH